MRRHIIYIFVIFAHSIALTRPANANEIRFHDDHPICVTSDGSDLCFNGGHCVEEDGDVRCQCTSDYFGSRCERRKCPVINPCYNGGLCEKTADSFACHCPLGFKGRYCLDRVPTVCDTRPCAHGRCTVTHTVNDYTCQCHYGYTGANCTEVDHCLGARCIHGECLNRPEANGHICMCERGWTGAACDEDVNECASEHSPCANGGQCVNVQGDYICKCATGFGGRNCELADDGAACRAELCLHEGTCVAADAPPPPTSPAASARRAAIWRRFNALLDDYDDALAGANETAGAGWRCDCQPGYYGARCEERVDECALNDFALATLRADGGDGDDAWWEYAMCINGGVCVGRGGSTRSAVVMEAVRSGLTAHALGATCKCPAGFTGEHCEKDVDECAVSADHVNGESSGLCANGGTCVNTFGGYRCTCVGGFTGTHCETNIDDCVDNICYPGSTCVDGVSRYDCVCEEGRIGMLCEHEDPCYGDRNPCAHGQCYPNHMYGNYTCACDNGFTGRNCDVDVDECARDTNLCARYGGRCINTVGAYRCEHAPNCSLGLCQNDAFCLDYDNDYECICLPGFVGRHCETVTSPAVPACKLRCANGGTCKHDGARGADVCHCPPQFTGPSCETRVAEKPAEATASPSHAYTIIHPSQQDADCRITACRNNGTCRAPRRGNDSGDATAAISERHVCECLPGFAGAFCELDVNECLTAPCENQARCVDLINGFRCDCAPGFAGERCEINVDDCANVTCLHGGRCVDGVNAFRCECADDYAGAYCEVDLRSYERADEAQRARCRANDCAAKAQNGRCDPECNFYACEYDGGDCALRQAQPFASCGPLQSYCAHAFGNGRCDPACNVEKCLFDGFDCAPPLARCAAFDFCAPRYADGRCDAACNSAACGWDGGDCDVTATTTALPPSSAPNSPSSDRSDSNLLNGELSLVILGTPAEFFRLAPRFLIELSAHLRASLRVSVDAQSRSRIYAWRSDSGANESTPLELPGELRAQQLNVAYEDARSQLQLGTVGSNKSILNANNSNGTKTSAVLYGVKIYLLLDVTTCASKAHGWSCFSELETAAQYLSADSAKMRLGDLGGVQLYSAEAVRSPEPPSNDKAGRRILELTLAAIFLMVTAAVLVIMVPRRRKAINASIWRPKAIAKKHKAGYMAGGPAYGDFTNCSTTSATNSNRSLAMNNNNSNNNTPLMIDGGDGKTTMYQPGFGPQMGTMRPMSASTYPSVYELYATIGANGATASDISLAPQPPAGYATIAPKQHSNNNSNNNNGALSYSSSSGVSSGQTSPDYGTANNNAGVDTAAVKALHMQARYSLMLSEPIDSTLVDARDSNGRTALHVLVAESPITNAHAFAECVNRLLAAGADINAQDNNGDTALILAIKRSRVDLVTLLVKCGADVNLMDAEERAPLHHAISAPHTPEIFRRLLAVAELDLNAMERRRRSPLALCASMVNCPTALEFARLLAEHGADVNRAGERDAVLGGEDHFSAPTPLHIAASVNNAAMIRLLVVHKANKDAKDAQEQSPLCLAAKNGHMDAVRELLTLGADKNQCDSDEKTPMELALAANYGDIAAFIDAFRPSQVNAVTAGLPQATKASPGTQQNGGPSRAESTQRAGVKRVHASPTAARKDSVKALKTKRTSSNGAASNLMALTPPNSDQSVYSTTPSPNHALSAAVAGPSTSAAAAMPSYGRPVGYGGEFYNGRIPLTLIGNLAGAGGPGTMQTNDLQLPYHPEAYARVGIPPPCEAAAWTTASPAFYPNKKGNSGNNCGYVDYGGPIYPPPGFAAYDAHSPESICDRTPPLVSYLKDTEHLLPHNTDNAFHQQHRQQQQQQQQHRQQQPYAQQQLSLASNFDAYGNHSAGSATIRSMESASFAAQY